MRGSERDELKEGENTTNRRVLQGSRGRRCFRLGTEGLMAFKKGKVRKRKGKAKNESKSKARGEGQREGQGTYARLRGRLGVRLLLVRL